jgi:predicted flap endonuclease-1-like 5' DNA nuclease
VALLVAWWALVATRKTRIERSEAQPAEETPARRNQALIDAARSDVAVDVPPPTPDALAGVGTAVAASAEPLHVSPAIGADDLKQIKGIGPRLEALLNSLGVTSYAQIAAWNDAEIDRIDAQLGNFQGRIRRDDWPTQARLLAAGDRAEFENRFGKI